MTVNTKELLKYLNEADMADFRDCLKENLEKDSAEHFNMLCGIYHDDKEHFNLLSAGCKAAMLTYIGMKGMRG